LAKTEECRNEDSVAFCVFEKFVTLCRLGLGLGLGHPSVELNKCFVCNTPWKMTGWGAKRLLELPQSPELPELKTDTEIARDW
jgi:hypothetical protein